MNTVSQTTSNVMAQNAQSVQDTKASDIKKKVVSGKTIGNPELSEKAQKYYEQLKKKYNNMDFVLVSEDQKENAKAHAGDYANANRMVVLIDTDKIEKMASDENYRKQYESIIGGATAKMAQLQTSLGSAAGSVKTYGMQVKDGGVTSFFAVIDKSLTSQKQRIEKTKEKKAQEKASKEKKAKKEEAQERLHNRKDTDTDEKIKESDKTGNYVTVTADSVEELLKKINDTLYSFMSDSVQTEEEKMLGQHIDFKG